MMSSVTANLSSEDLRSARQELWSKLQNIDTRLKQTYVAPHFRITTSSTNNQRTFSTNGQQSSTDSTASAKRSRVSSSSYDDHNSSLPENNFDESSTSSKSLHSSIVPTNKIIKTKDDLISLVNRDQQSTGRNRRMFGILLGTLNKFKAEANAYNEQTVGMKRHEIERRLDEKQEKEREDKKHERTELLATKRDCQQQLKLVNMKLEIMQRLATYEKNHEPLRNFIRTKTKPYVFYLPKGPMDDVLEKKFQESRLEIEKEMEEFKRESQQKLESLEDISTNPNDDDDDETTSSKKRKLDEHDDGAEDDDDATLADLPDEITFSAPEVKSEIVNTSTEPLNHTSTAVPKSTRTVIYDDSEATDNKQDDESMADE
jgi:pinin